MLTEVFEVVNGQVSIEQCLEDNGLKCDGEIIPVILCLIYTLICAIVAAIVDLYGYAILTIEMATFDLLIHGLVATQENLDEK